MIYKRVMSRIQSLILFSLLLFGSSFCQIAVVDLGFLYNSVAEKAGYQKQVKNLQDELSQSLKGRETRLLRLKSEASELSQQARLSKDSEDFDELRQLREEISYLELELAKELRSKEQSLRKSKAQFSVEIQTLIFDVVEQYAQSEDLLLVLEKGQHSFYIHDEIDITRDILRLIEREIRQIRRN